MAGISAKLIKPKPLKRGVMTANMKAAAEKASIDMAKDMTKVTSGWSDGGLKFVGTVKSKRDSYLISAIPANPKSKRAQIWVFLDEGTGLWGPKRAKYPIEPKKKGGKLRFASGYKAGSKPNTVTTSSSASFGDTVYREKVMHPGIQPRNWTKLRLAKWKKKIVSYAEDGIKLAIKESGHAYKKG